MPKKELFFPVYSLWIQKTEFFLYLKSKGDIVLIVKK